MHLVTSLERAGAQAVLSQLVRRMGANRAHESVIVSLTSIGDVGAALAEDGILVYELGLSRGGFAWLSAFRRLAAIIRRHSPDVLHSWLYHADLVGSIARQCGTTAPLVWGVHHESPFQTTRFLTRAVVRLNAALSTRIPSSIVYCSNTARETHEAVGYCRGKGIVIENGVDVDVFSPSLIARGNLRRELGLLDSAVLIGLVARYHPLKDHRTFLNAARIYGADNPSAHFVLCGHQITQDNLELLRLIEESGLSGRVHLLGSRNDPANVTAALDVACCTSRSESFSMTIAEAMACEVPCVATDIPAVKDLLGGNGRIVPVGDGPALAVALRDILEMPTAVREKLAAETRKRVVDRFSADLNFRRYVSVYESVQT